MKFTRKDFMASAAAFAVSPMLADGGRKIKGHTLRKREIS